MLELVWEMMTLTLTLLVPLVLAGLAGGIVGGLFVGYVGLQDQAIAAMIRAASVIVAVVITGSAMYASVQEFTATAWAQIATIGQIGEVAY